MLLQKKFRLQSLGSHSSSRRDRWGERAIEGVAIHPALDSHSPVTAFIWAQGISQRRPQNLHVRFQACSLQIAVFIVNHYKRNFLTVPCEISSVVQPSLLSLASQPKVEPESCGKLRELAPIRTRGRERRHF